MRCPWVLKHSSFQVDSDLYIHCPTRLSLPKLRHKFKIAKCRALIKMQLYRAGRWQNRWLDRHMTVKWLAFRRTAERNGTIVPMKRLPLPRGWNIDFRITNEELIMTYHGSVSLFGQLRVYISSDSSSSAYLRRCSSDGSWIEGGFLFKAPWCSPGALIYPWAEEAVATR